MGVFGLIVGMLLPWLLGVVWLRTRWMKASDICWPTLLGYGYLAGALATTLVMRLLDMLGMQLGFISIGMTLLLLTVVGVWAGRGIPLHWRNIGLDWRNLATWHKAAYAALLMLVVIRLGGLGLELMWRPLFPWDAWSWAIKARVWYEFGHLLPFVPGDVWLAGKLPGAYTAGATSNYPPALPLLQVWMSDSLGRWDDALMNLPWLLCAIALGLAFYGQARQWQIPPLLALVFTYFLFSLPILDTHIALAGYADLFMGAFYGLAAMAFLHWSRTRDFWQGAMALLFALGGILIKQPGIVWALTFLPALWVVFMPRAGLPGVAMLAAAGGAALFALEGRGFDLFGYHVNLHFAVNWEPFWRNLLVLDNWHLLWYLAAVVLVWSLPKLWAPPFRAMTTLLFAAVAFIAVTFFFTQAQAWADNYVTINRALLHLVPMLLFYIMVLLQEAVDLPVMATREQT